MTVSPQFRNNRLGKLKRLTLEQSQMLSWARRGERSFADPEVKVHLHHEPDHAVGDFAAGTVDTDLQRGLRLLTFNIQVGITTSRYRHYVTNGWKHVLPHGRRNDNLRRIADVVADYDFVALQEADAGSLRSGFINQVEYIADQAQFPYWYSQLNRDLAPFARHGSGLLSRIAPNAMEDHRLPGAIPGRGAIAARLPGCISGPYGTGGMIAFQAFDGDAGRTKQLLAALFEAGVIAFAAGANPTRVRFLPPLAVISDAEIDAACEILEQVLVAEAGRSLEATP